MHVILDIDLDFFVWPVSHWITTDERLPDEECTHLASEEEVRRFLEQRCHLSRSAPVPGQQFREHEDAFRVWRRWLSEGELRAPFIVVHVDAHADLGAGINLTASYVQTELLALPVEGRSEPRFGSDGLSSGNYLVCAIANRWLNSLTYVFPTGPAPTHQPQTGKLGIELFEDRVRKIRKLLGENDDLPPVEDLPPWCLRDGDWKTGQIELAQYRPEDFLGCKPIPVHVEPAVPLTLVADNTFELSGSCTHMVIAQSPQYTSKAADRLLPVIAEYFTPA